MYGFDTKALLLFPSFNYYEESGYKSKANLKLAAINMCKYLRSRGLEPHAFLTDDVARYFAELDFHWLSTLNAGDRFFMSKNCNMAGNVVSMQAEEFPELYKKSEEKYPYPEKPSVEERFNIMVARDQFVAKKIIATYPVVVNFYYKGASVYKAAKKPGDGKIRLIVDLKTYRLEAYMDKEEEDVIDLIGASYANRAVTSWQEV